MAELSVVRSEEVGVSSRVEIKSASSHGEDISRNGEDFTDLKLQEEVLPAISCLTPCGAKFLDGQKLEFDSVILCTGYRSNVPNWLKDSDFFSDDGMPKMPFPDGWKGENGLYSVGFTKRGLLGASLDARRIAQDIGGLLRAGRKQQFVLA